MSHSQNQNTIQAQYFVLLVQSIKMSSLALLIFVWPVLAFGQVGCGAIYAPETPWYDALAAAELEETPISACATPFGPVVADWPAGLAVVVDGVSLSPGVEFSIAAAGTNDHEVRLSNRFGATEVGWFLHTDRGYEFKHTNPPRPERADIERLAAEFFAPGVDSSPYIEAVLAREFYINNDTDQLLFDFYDYIKAEFEPVLPTLLPGTYTVVIINSYVIPVEAVPSGRPGLWQWLFPTAYAAVPAGDEVYTMTFTLVSAAAVAGPPSVLFLPGIMGSRLFEEDTSCGFGAEQQRWFAFQECDQLRLALDDDGQSVHDLYTKPGREGIVDEAAVADLYKSFIDSLEAWQQAGEINDFALVPYDWRRSLPEVLKSRFDPDTGHIVYDGDTTLEESYFYQVLADLVAGSAGGTVTIVSHSNGGLLAKYFIHALEEAHDPLLAKINNLVLVGVPQFGTPDSMIGLLQGTTLDYVMGQATTRALVNTMPFAYHLLPGRGYFESVMTPVISFESGSNTNGWRQQFGPQITSREDLHAFMSTESGRAKPKRDDVLIPEVVGESFLDYAKAAEVFQTSFAAPSGMKVYQVAGTGVMTPSGLEYFTKQVCRLSIHGMCLEYVQELGYRVQFVIDGDDSVVTPSALAMSEVAGVERWWLDLKEYNSNRREVDKIHKDIFEVADIIGFISDVATGNSSPEHEFIGRNSPIFTDENRLVLQLHSPLDLSVILSDGVVVSSSTPNIRNVAYRRFGEVQTLTIPEAEQNFTILFVGIGTGSFTLDLEQYQGNNLLERGTYSAIPSSTSTRVSLELAGVSDTDYELVLDYEGDGVIDQTYRLTETVVIEKPVQKGSKGGSKKRILVRPTVAETVARTRVVTYSVDQRHVEIITLAQEVVRLLALLVEYNKSK